MKKIIIAGGPHAGKTTLLEALKNVFTEAYFIPEPAETLIKHEQTRQKQNPQYIPVLPWIDYKTFGPAVVQESVVLESGIPPGADLVFQDRSLIDAIGYCRLNQFDTFIPEVQKLIAQTHYDVVFFCEPVGEYLATSIRKESYDQAKKTHEALLTAYLESGLPLIQLPSVSVDQRTKTIQDTIEPQPKS